MTGHLWGARTPVAIALAFCIALAAMPANAALPGTMAATGVLRGPGGQPVADGVYSLTLRLHDAQTGGKVLWTEITKMAVAGGAFHHILGQNKAISPLVAAGNKAIWLGVQVGADPELPRVSLHAVAYAMRAQTASGLACSGCVAGKHLADGSVGATKMGFSYAGSASKGGPATSALGLKCTGCVSVAQMKFDGDLDLGGNALKTKQLAAGTITAQSVIASTLQGDGSKLTGIAKVSGSCAKSDEVVQGILPDGSLKCIKALGAGGLPADGLAAVSNGLLINEFVHSMASAKAVPIQDNSPVGTSDELTFPDVGVAKKLSVSAHISNSHIGQLIVELYDPANSKYVLKKGGGAGKVLKATWPAPDKPVSGDLTAWVGKNPKGKWRLRVIDGAFLNNGKDGAIESWSVNVQTLSNKTVQATGELQVKGDLAFTNDGQARMFRFQNSKGAPAACTPARRGLAYYELADDSLRVCNGEQYINAAKVATPPGSAAHPGTDCLDIKKQSPAAKSGLYWIEPVAAKPAAAFQVWCEMDTDGGGWTLLARTIKAGLTGGDKTTIRKSSWNTHTQVGYGSPAAGSRLYWMPLERWRLLTKRWPANHFWSRTSATGVRVTNLAIGDAAQKYKWSWSGGVAGFNTLISQLNGAKFTTFDADNDSWSGNCSSTNIGINGGFWYTDCYQLSMLHSNGNVYALYNNVSTSVAFNELYFRPK